MMTSAGTSLDIAARNHRVFHRFNRECEEATDPLFIYSNTFNGFLSDKERRPATYHLITKDDSIVLLKMVEDRTCSTVNSHFTTLDSLVCNKQLRKERDASCSTPGVPLLWLRTTYSSPSLDTCTIGNPAD